MQSSRVVCKSDSATIVICLHGLPSPPPQNIKHTENNTFPPTNWLICHCYKHTQNNAFPSKIWPIWIKAEEMKGELKGQEVGPRGVSGQRWYWAKGQNDVTTPWDEAGFVTSGNINIVIVILVIITTIIIIRKQKRDIRNFSKQKFFLVMKLSWLQSPPFFNNLWRFRRVKKLPCN